MLSLLNSRRGVLNMPHYQPSTVVLPPISESASPCAPFHVKIMPGQLLLSQLAAVMSLLTLQTAYLLTSFAHPNNFTRSTRPHSRPVTCRGHCETTYTRATPACPYNMADLIRSLLSRRSFRYHMKMMPTTTIVPADAPAAMPATYPVVAELSQPPIGWSPRLPDQR